MTDMTDRELLELAPSSVAAILLREHDNVDQAIAYAERMAQRYAGISTMAFEYAYAAQELKKAWKQNKHR